MAFAPRIIVRSDCLYNQQVHVGRGAQSCSVSRPVRRLKSSLGSLMQVGGVLKTELDALVERAKKKSPRNEDRVVGCYRILQA